MGGMRNEAYCGVCGLWLRGGLSNHNRGKKHNILLAKIHERIEELRNISDQGELCASSISNEQSKRDEQTNQ